jgi:hypothetical protein
MFNQILVLPFLATLLLLIEFNSIQFNSKLLKAYENENCSSSAGWYRV